MPNVINGTSTGSGGLITTGDDSGILNIQTNETTAMSIDASQSVDFTNNIDAPNTFGFKNRIINGNMVIAQRGTTFTNPASGDYTLDRMQYRATQTSFQCTIAQSSSSPPTGFTNFLLWTSTNATAVAATDRIAIGQVIEANNISDLGWGTANAKAVTLSFWVRCSVTGTLGGAIQNATENYCYPFSYTVNAANTWEFKTVAITGPTSGTWAVAQNAGAKIYFSLGTGSSLESTAGTWVAAERWSATGTVDLVTTSANTLAITGFQFEVGTQATSFDFRDYGRELALCQRYCFRISGADSYSPIGTGTAYNGTTSGRIQIPFPVPMRTAPTASFGGTIQVVGNTAATPASFTLGTTYGGKLGLMQDISWSGAMSAAGVGLFVYVYNTSSDYFQLTAEL